MEKVEAAWLIVLILVCSTFKCARVRVHPRTFCSSFSQAIYLTKICVLFNLKLIQDWYFVAVCFCDVQVLRFFFFVAVW